MHNHAHEPAGSAFNDLPAEFESTQENHESNAQAPEGIPCIGFEYSLQPPSISASRLMLSLQRLRCDRRCSPVLGEHGVRAIFI
jgi:hypothetical protein